MASRFRASSCKCNRPWCPLVSARNSVTRNVPEKTGAQSLVRMGTVHRMLEELPRCARMHRARHRSGWSAMFPLLLSPALGESRTRGPSLVRVERLLHRADCIARRNNGFKAILKLHKAAIHYSLASSYRTPVALWRS